ncbi:MAG TPA: histidine--tRNA ligase [Candidatus Saccharimonadales bacterium]|nr:histidine--tRNA ligase [Candidatus Saccharimonadales bacterium]
MALSTQPYKGARDFYPEDKRLQKYMFNTIRRTVEKFGYEEYDAPVLEPVELYLAKTGEEIVNEQTYAFEDRGGRKVALRPEMTPTVSRLVAAKRQELAYPLRLFNIGGRWRYERPQRGRYREFYQADVDIFGIEGVAAEHEIIQVADHMLRAFGATREMYTIRLNSRKLMDYVLHDFLGCNEVQAQSIAKLIDRIHKIEHAEFLVQADALFSPSQRDAGAVGKLLHVLNAKKPELLPDEVRSQVSFKEILNVMQLLQASGVTNLRFDPTIVRGFDYYTGIVFEVFDTDTENNRSMFGGGRYDGLVGLFGVEPVPTVGFAMGDVTLANFLESHELIPELQPEVDVYAIFVGNVWDQAQKVVELMRSEGLNVACDLTDRKLDKQIKTADKKGIHYVVIIGQKEIDDGRFVLKHLGTGAEERHSAARIASIVKDYRAKHLPHSISPTDDDLDIEEV